MRAFAVFDHRPTAAGRQSFELDAAPDGVQFYTAATGRWQGPFAGYDWSSWLLPSMSCDSELVSQHGFHSSMDLRTDLTGDGIPDYVVVAACPASTSAWPIMAAVADGASPPGAPRNLGIVSGNECWRTISLHTAEHQKTTQLVLTGEVVGRNDPMCCPSHRVTLTVGWTAGHFATVSRSDRPL